MCVFFRIFFFRSNQNDRFQVAFSNDAFCLHEFLIRIRFMHIKSADLLKIHSTRFKQTVNSKNNSHMNAACFHLHPLNETVCSGDLSAQFFLNSFAQFFLPLESINCALAKSTIIGVIALALCKQQQQIAHNYPVAFKCLHNEM